jgi:hypothetical protein
MDTFNNVCYEETKICWAMEQVTPSFFHIFGGDFSFFSYYSMFNTASSAAPQIPLALLQTRRLLAFNYK